MPFLRPCEPSDEDIKELLELIPPQRRALASTSLYLEIAARQLLAIRKSRQPSGIDVIAFNNTLDKLGA